MDIQRFLLIAASAALSLMLLVEWTAFKDARTANVDRERLVDRAANYGSDYDNTGEPNGINPEQLDVPAGSAASQREDIPTINVPGDQKSPSAPEITDNASHYVQVKTDTLEVVIDLRGGDIVETALPKFPENIETPDIPFVILEENNTRTYVAQSGLVGPNGIDTPERAVYSTPVSNYEMVGKQPLTVTLTAMDTAAAVQVEKRYTFTPASYTIDLEYVMTNNGSERWSVVPFAQLKRDSSQPPSADKSGFGMQPFLGAATTTTDKRFKKFSFSDIQDDPWKASLPGGWIAIMQHYFVAAWIPAPNETHNYSTRQTKAGFNIAGLTSPTVTVEPGGQSTYAAKLYVGPKDQPTLEKLAPHLDLVVDYGWLWWIAKPLFWVLTTIHEFVQNWGVAIILLTVLVKGAFFKLSAASYRSMAKMRKVQPKMQSIREQYADDKQKQSQAMMELYRKEKINPMGGCLPVLIQMPVFIALYWVLMESVELRQAPFALWINDLSVMDPYFVLPLLMGASMFFMQKLNPPPPDPMQAKIMQWLPVVFTFFFLWFPSGLVLYWVTNNLLSIAQQWVITRSIEREAANH